jgi:hypothetical protein
LTGVIRRAVSMNRDRPRKDLSLIADVFDIIPGYIHGVHCSPHHRSALPRAFPNATASAPSVPASFNAAAALLSRSAILGLSGVAFLIWTSAALTSTATSSCFSAGKSSVASSCRKSSSCFTPLICQFKTVQVLGIARKIHRTTGRDTGCGGCQIVYYGLSRHNDRNIEHVRV